MFKYFRKFVIYPVLFGILPVFVLYSSNKTLAISETFRSFIVTFGLALILLSFLHFVIRNWHRAGLVVILVSFFFYNFSQILILLGNILQTSLNNLLSPYLAVVASTLIIGIWGIIRVLRKPELFTFPLNFVSACLILINVSMIGIHNAQSFNFLTSSTVKAASIPNDSIPQSANLDKRDIYYIILDGYARSDVLKELYDIDNRPFAEK